MKRQAITSPKQLEDEQVKEKIAECFHKVRGIYGYRRIKVWIEKKYEQHINRKRIHRLMKVMGLFDSNRGIANIPKYFTG
ncbi:IS3 family transposase [Brevibacillus brevis]|uniref:IS3 family transposase n=1 Tax=Brevibacillus brevis TaxID=1393 RepID=UPI0025A5D709|nr:IS3 family transposase [Brevibacillus brevis]WJQ82915.1 IS3 family transposase [Brevibacillus brevis]